MVRKKREAIKFIPSTEKSGDKIDYDELVYRQMEKVNNLASGDWRDTGRLRVFRCSLRALEGAVNPYLPDTYGDKKDKIVKELDKINLKERVLVGKDNREIYFELLMDWYDLLVIELDALGLLLEEGISEEL